MTHKDYLLFEDTTPEYGQKVNIAIVFKDTYKVIFGCRYLRYLTPSNNIPGYFQYKVKKTNGSYGYINFYPDDIKILSWCPF